MYLVSQLDQLFQTHENSGIKSDFHVKPTMRMASHILRSLAIS